jgi:hypothetical protein
MIVHQHSLFVADCVCGRHFETTACEYVCPACHRQIVLEWPGKAESEPPVENQPSTPEADA